MPKMFFQAGLLMAKGDFPPGMFVMDVEKVKEFEYINYHFILKKDVDDYSGDFLKLKWDLSKLSFFKKE